MKEDYLNTVRKQFLYYKSLGEKTFAQLTDEQFFYPPNAESNSIAIIIKHLHGNMMSRWTDFLTTDGEKKWRQRDDEFEIGLEKKEDLILKWEQGWLCFFAALDEMQKHELSTKIFIRKEQHTFIDAVNRQLAHYSYHVGQIVYLGKLIAGENWKSLSILKNQSAKFNKEMEEKAAKS